MLGRNVSIPFGFHAVYEQDVDTAFAAARRHGFEFVQFDLNVPRFQVDVLEAEHLRELSRRTGVAFSFHAPADMVSLYTDLSDVRDAILRHYVRILALAAEAGARHLTIHAGEHPRFRRADGSAEFSRLHSGHYDAVLRENLNELLDRSGGVLVCLENYKLTPGVRRVAEEIFAAGKNLRLCWDLPKSHGKPDEESFLRSHLDLVAELHLHDLGADGLSHIAVGEGIIDFASYQSLFDATDRWCTVEVRPVHRAAESRDRLVETFLDH